MLRQEGQLNLSLQPLRTKNRVRAGVQRSSPNRTAPRTELDQPIAHLAVQLLNHLSNRKEGSMVKDFLAHAFVFTFIAAYAVVLVAMSVWAVRSWRTLHTLRKATEEPGLDQLPRPETPQALPPSPLPDGPQVPGEPEPSPSF
jgi:hypothetical protein